MTLISLSSFTLLYLHTHPFSLLTQDNLQFRTEHVSLASVPLSILYCSFCLQVHTQLMLVLLEVFSWMPKVCLDIMTLSFQLTCHY